MSRAALDRGRCARAILVVVLAASAATGLRLFAAEAMTVESLSMAPTVLPGEIVLVEKWQRTPGRGALIAFRSPQDGALMLKRVAGTAGDVVEIRDGELFVNNEWVDEPYLDHETVDAVYYGPVTVPDRMVHVLGDARQGSIDSRTFGPVSRDDVIGQVRLSLWPFTRPDRTSGGGAQTGDGAISE